MPSVVYRFGTRVRKEVEVTRLILLGSVIALALLSPSPAEAQVGQWQLLGQRPVSVQGGRETIPATSLAGRISRIQIRVADNDVEVESVELTFGDGQRASVSVDRVLPAGGRTSGIDIPGTTRILRSAEVVYRVRGDAARGRPTIQLWGLLAGPLIPPAVPRVVLPHPPDRPVPAQPPALDAPERSPATPDGGTEAEWRSLATGGLDLESDRARIQVGEERGRLERIALLIRDQEIHLIEVRITFADGATQQIRVDQRVRAGHRTPPFEINDGPRAIRQLELIYRSGPGLSGTNRVTLLGQP